MTFISHIDVLTAELPFRFSFGHALAERSSSTNVFVRLALADGSVGYGEGVPREYVTGETVAGATSALADRLAPALLGATIEAAEEAIVNAVVAAETMVGKNGATAHGLDTDQLVDVMRRAGKLDG